MLTDPNRDDIAAYDPELYVAHPVPSRFWKRVDKSGDCWIWTGAKDGHGYGDAATSKGRHRLAHRIAYELERGKIPAGLVLDHLCRNPPCVNPDHLEPVTQGENVRRGARAFAFDGRCKSGRHEIKGDSDIRVKSKGRTCRACDTERESRRAAILKQAAALAGLRVKAYRSTFGSSMEVARYFIQESDVNQEIPEYPRAPWVENIRDAADQKRDERA